MTTNNEVIFSSDTINRWISETNPKGRGATPEKYLLWCAHTFGPSLVLPSQEEVKKSDVWLNKPKTGGGPTKGASPIGMTEDEKTLLRNFRALSPEEQEEVYDDVSERANKAQMKQREHDALEVLKSINPAAYEAAKKALDAAKKK